MRPSVWLCRCATRTDSHRDSPRYVRDQPAFVATQACQSQTTASYRDSFRLLLVKKQLKTEPVAHAVKALDAPLVLSFLDSRGARKFCHYLQMQSRPPNQ